MLAVRRIVLACLVAALAVIAAGCGGDDGPAAHPATTTTATAAATTRARPRSALRIGLVTGAGRAGDRALDDLARRGLRRAETQLGVRTRVLVSRTGADYLPNLSRLAEDGSDLVVALGAPMAPAVAKAARRYPDVRFAIADVSNDALDGAPRNVRGLVFEEQEAGYLAGYLAGLLEERESGSLQTISSVGGRKGPAVDRYIGGFQAGALDANLQVTTHNDYAGEVSDQAKCKELALNQIGQGSDIVFAVAGRCGLGALEAAKERNVWGIGADTDLGYLGPHVLTSAVKRVDVAVFETIRALRAGTFTGGEDAVFDVASGGVGLGRISPRVPSDIVAQVKQMQSRIASGSLGPIRETVR